MKWMDIFCCSQFLLYEVHQISGAATGEPTLLEYGRLGEWAEQLFRTNTVIFSHIVDKCRHIADKNGNIKDKYILKYK